MNKILMTGLCVFVSKLLQAFTSDQGTSGDLTKIKLTTVYLHAIKISRLLFISLVGSGACLIFLMTGLILIHHTILFYAPWGISVKVTVTLMFAVMYIAIAAGSFAYFFAEDRWMKMFNAEAMIKEFTGK